MTADDSDIAAKDPLADIVGITHTKPDPIAKYNNNKNTKNKEKGKGQKNNNDNNGAKTEYLQKYHGNDDLLAEAIIIGGKPYFAIAAPKFGTPDETSIILQESIPLNENITVKPPEFISYINKPYTFKSEQEFQQLIDIAKKETLDTLYIKVKSIWKKYVDADDFHLSTCAADTIYTYFQDKIGLTHYLFFVGNNGSGKSNNLRVFQFLGYRNMTSTDMTAANIYQFLGSMEEGQGTICEDEADNIDSEDKDKMRIYKNGHTTGYPVLRTDTSCGRKQQRFNTFCFKAFAAERTPDSIKAKGFNQRIIELSCVYGFPQYDISEIINPAGEGEFHELLKELNETRNLLLIYRLIRYQDKIPNVKLNIENREKQLFKPLIRVFQRAETLKELLPIISKYVRQKRESNANSLYAFIYRTIKELIEAQNTTELESGLIWNTSKETLQGNAISNKPQSYQSVEFGVLSQKEIVKILKDVFYAKKVNRHGENRKLAFDKEKLDKMGKIYDLSIDIEVKREEGEGVTEQKMETNIGTHGTDINSGVQMKVIEPEIAGTHGTHGTHVGIDRHTLNQENEDNKKVERDNEEQQEKDYQVNPKEMEKITDEQKQKQTKEDTIINANSLPNTSKGSQ